MGTTEGGNPVTCSRNVLGGEVMGRSASIELMAASFRDPSGVVFKRRNKLYRQVRTSYAQQYDQLIESGLYDALVAEKLLLQHAEVSSKGFNLDGSTYKLLSPNLVPFISYPYEWCFEQLRDAALSTLRIQKIALKYGMILKDASAYNIQFVGHQPLLIDTLSFEVYREGQPWLAYKQFCEHFLAPLVLMSYQHPGISKLLQSHIDGIPLKLAAILMPKKAWLKPSLIVHIVIHANTQKKYEGSALPQEVEKARLPKDRLEAIIDDLIETITSLKSPSDISEWSDYYSNNNYSSSAQDEKEKIIAEYLHHILPETCWDLGANTGAYSWLAASMGIQTVSMDLDPACVEANYKHCKDRDCNKILPLVMDLSNPSPSIGWANEERMSLAQRGPADAAMALALIHHLAIGNNVPLERIGKFLATICRHLIIEFVPKSDSQVQRLLSTRKDVFSDYSQEEFEAQFAKFFQIESKQAISGSERTLYMMSVIE